MKKTLNFLILSVFEIVLSGLVLYVSYYLRFLGSIPPEHLAALKTVIPLFSICFWILMVILGVYFSGRILDIHVFRKLIISSFLHLAIAFTIVLFYNMYSSREILLSRWVFVLYFFLLIFFDLVFRTFLESITESIIRRSGKNPGLLIIGGRDLSRKELKRLSELLRKDYALNIYTDSEGLESPDFSVVSGPGLINLTERFRICVILFFNPQSGEDVKNVINELSGLDLDFWINPEKIHFLSDGYKLLPVEDSPFFRIITHPIYGINLFLKRFFDLVMSSFLIILTFPLYIILPVLIKLDSKGDVFFSQIRLGLKGRPIKIIKFRSMFQNAEDTTGPVWTGRNDPRITRVGRFLRRFSLDELPQLFLVFSGLLSIVGPRPERPYFIDNHPAYKGIRLLVKPGLTGLAQINGRYDLTFEERLNYDIYYINNYSIWLDLEIFFKTIIIILFQKGAR